MRTCEGMRVGEGGFISYCRWPRPFIHRCSEQRSPPRGKAGKKAIDWQGSRQSKDVQIESEQEVGKKVSDPISCSDFNSKSERCCFHTDSNVVMKLTFDKVLEELEAEMVENDLFMGILK